MTDLLKLTGPSVNRHRSKQDYGTPQTLIDAIEKRFGKLSWDLACSNENKKAPSGITEEQNSFTVDWHKLGGLLWLNPPFSDIAPWAEKCMKESRLGATIFFLTPASVDANWWADFVHGQADVLFVSPRVKFVGAVDPYPKPVSLSIYNSPLPQLQYEPWRWKNPRT